MSKPWGYHYTIDAGGCERGLITDADNIRDFSGTLVDAIEMVAYGEPQVVKFGSGDKEGYTLVQLIETSNICAHFVDETDELYLDVFSCKPFDGKVVERLVKRFFGATRVSAMFVTRQAPAR